MIVDPATAGVVSPCPPHNSLGVVASATENAPGSVSLIGQIIAGIVGITETE